MYVHKQLRQSLTRCNVYLHQRYSDKQLVHNHASQIALRNIINERSNTKNFDPLKTVNDKVLADVLRLTQRAPTSFNTQPYACIVIRSANERAQLAEAMIGESNQQAVKDAPVVVVFAADLEPSSRVSRIQQLMENSGASTASIHQLPIRVSLFSGEGVVARNMRSLVDKYVSPLTPVPKAATPVAWSFKQTSFAAATFLYAATAYGLQTAAMEGFDSTRIRHNLDLPERYEIPVVICCGYAKDDQSRPTKKKSLRLDPSEVFFDGKFGESMHDFFVNHKEIK